MPVSGDLFRRVLGSFASGVTVVTTRAVDEVHGTTMSAVSAVSLTPPLVLVCVDRAAQIHDLIGRGQIFAVNILHEGQRDLSQILARKGTPELESAHRLENVAYRTGMTGAPILLDHLAYLDCRVAQAVRAGDHTIYVGQVEDAGLADRPRTPLLYYRGQYKKVHELGAGSR